MPRYRVVAPARRYGGRPAPWRGTVLVLEVVVAVAPTPHEDQHDGPDAQQYEQRSGHDQDQREPAASAATAGRVVAERGDRHVVARWRHDRYGRRGARRRRGGRLHPQLGEGEALARPDVGAPRHVGGPRLLRADRERAGRGGAGLAALE